MRHTTSAHETPNIIDHISGCEALVGFMYLIISKLSAGVDFSYILEHSRGMCVERRAPYDRVGHYSPNLRKYRGYSSQTAVFPPQQMLRENQKDTALLQCSGKSAYRIDIIPAVNAYFKTERRPYIYIYSLVLPDYEARAVLGAFSWKY